MSTGVILLAAGSGSRFGQKKEKQLFKLRGEALFLKPLRCFLAVKSVAEINLVVPPGKEKIFERILSQAKLAKKVHLVAGGALRGKSVKNGFKAFQKKHQVVLVHDSARPLVNKEIISRVEGAAKKFGVALAAWPLADTLKFSDRKEFVQKTIPREQLWIAQTPQGFNWKAAERCLLFPLKTATDDVSLAEKKGYAVKLVAGAPFNFKVTYTHDLELCRAYLKK